MESLGIIGRLSRRIALDSLEWMTRLRGRAAGLPVHLSVGIEGEDAAFFYLARKGYTIVARRWSSGNRPGDIDLIAWHGDLLCFFEVKTRTAHDATPAEVAVHSHKRHILRQLARQYIRQLPQEERPEVRFDVISVYLVPGEEQKIIHFENSFGWNEWRKDFD
jgi:putative endonuclease